MNIPNEIRRKMSFPLPIERVWQAISTPQGLSRWFSDRVELDENGQDLALTWDDYGTVSARIEASEPPRRFAFRWGAHGYQSGQPYTEENSTLVTFFLSETPDGTDLTLSETGFAELAPEQRRGSFEDNSGGWTKELDHLQAYLASLETA